MKTDQERVRKLLSDTVTLLCKNGLVYNHDVKIEGLLGITVDKNDVFLVHINESIGGAPLSGQAAGTTASSEPSPRKKVVASSSHVVDLTRVTDEVLSPAKRSLPSQPSPGQVTPTRKHRPAVPATSMVPEHEGPPRAQLPPRMHQIPRMQHMSPRMQQAPRPRMGAGPQQIVATSHSASNYLAQFHQQTVRGVSPGRGNLPPRQRVAIQRQQVAARSQLDDDDDDDEDVVIVGTGHEEPSPSWSSPMRKRPLPSRMPISPAPQQKRMRSMPLQRSVADDSATAPQLLGGAESDLASALELTSDEVPSSVEDMIKEMVPVSAETLSKQVVPQHREVSLLDTAENSHPELIVPATKTEPTYAQYEGANVADAVGKDVLENLVENEETPATELLSPFVYTDVAFDMVSNIFT